ncbi:hypothetical protein AB0O76_35820 [Streptomyces sp. NPDC086554]|uniref:hypothetical protein n=1 Tax=Streptomyces sp. NPDC086554 TaxID=3154864 RepID=UPI003418CE7D
MRQEEAAIILADQNAARSHRSSQDLSASYIVRRCLHFDDEQFDGWYAEMLDARRILMLEPGSPRINIPFRQSNRRK